MTGAKWLVGHNSESGHSEGELYELYETFDDALDGLIETLDKSATFAAQAGEPREVRELETVMTLMGDIRGHNPRGLRFTAGRREYWLKAAH